ncbi:unnamed protein product [Ceratitis capitata]|uniref:(Mediterranean fruit fly) hypothetical protein n=1 Tax=Ceratitis capitata TaxID=7213 RepID=A0A811UWR7_CERCA|nr:unnamed protein product [Ceratitis capitata]
MDELKTTRLDSTIENYHFRINKIRNKLHNRILAHNDLSFSAEEVNRIALQAFKEHLPEPTKTMIIARNPDNLDKAYKIILEARHQTFTALGQTWKDPNPNSYRRTNFSDNTNNRTSFGSNQYINNNNNYNRNRFNNNMPHNRYDGGYVPMNMNNNNNNKYNNNGNRSNQTRMSYQTTYTSQNQPGNSNPQRNFNQQGNGYQRRNFNQSGNYNRSGVSNGNRPETMDIGNTALTFRRDTRNNYPI